MSSIKVDSDGVPYWNVLPGTRFAPTVEWSAFLAEVSDTIASAVWSVTPSALSISSSKVNGTKTVIWVEPSVGNANTSYTLTSKIFTPAPNSRRWKQKLRIKVGP